MGHWGTSISSNDTFMEVYEAYFHYYNHNAAIDEIKNQLEKDFAETLKDAQTSNDYWFALTKALWECKALDKETLEKVKKIIQEGSDLAVWKGLNATEKDLKAREKVLNKFLETISTEKVTAKARKKITRYSGVYEKGTCLAVKLPNGNYGGLLVLEQDIETLEGENLLAATNIHSATLPQVHDFKNAGILTARKTNHWGNSWEYFLIFVFEAKRKRYNKEAENLFINVGVLPIERVFEKYFETPYHHLDTWTDTAKTIEDSILKIANGEQENISATVAQWIIKK